MDSSGGRVVAGSNPVTPTGKKELSHRLNSFFCLLPLKRCGRITAYIYTAGAALSF